ncbi:MAG: hypothetical protein Kow0090_05070 [Myxococcota bacterium]
MSTRDGDEKIEITVGHGNRIIARLSASRVWIERDGICRTLRAFGIDDHNGEATVPLALLDTVTVKLG